MTSYTAVNDPAPTIYRDGFVRAYQEAFAGAPYFETYSTGEVLEEVWYPHLSDGMIILAIDDEQVVGFGCALPLVKSPDDVQEFLSKRYDDGTFPAPPNKTWYMSELGVLESHRRRGIGSKLIWHRLVSISHKHKNTGGAHYVFRTAADGSNSIHLYRKIGAKQIPVLQDVTSTDQVLVNGSQSPARVYLYGECEPAIRGSRAA